LKKEKKRNNLRMEEYLWVILKLSDRKIELLGMLCSIFKIVVARYFQLSKKMRFGGVFLFFL